MSDAIWHAGLNKWLDVCACTQNVYTDSDSVRVSIGLLDQSIDNCSLLSGDKFWGDFTDGPNPNMLYLHWLLSAINIYWSGAKTVPVSYSPSLFYPTWILPDSWQIVGPRVHWSNNRKYTPLLLIHNCMWRLFLYQKRQSNLLDLINH